MSDVLEIYLARHGQSQANSKNIIQGQSSTPLSEFGLRQATALGTALANLQFDAVYSSDLERAMQTARAAAPGHEPVPCKELREWNLGLFQGLTYEEVALRHPVEWSAFKSAKSNFQVPGGESAEDIYRRVTQFAEKIVAKHNTGRILLVSHGGAIRVLLKYALNIKTDWPAPPKITNASYSKFIVQNGVWCLETWNSTQHLAGLIANTGNF